MTYDTILRRASTRFNNALDPIIKTYMDEREGLLFHLSVEVQTEDIDAKWAEAIDALIEAVGKTSRDRVFEQLSLPRHGVIFAQRSGALRFVVAYVPPTIDENGNTVPGYESARFDTAGIEYPATHSALTSAPE